MRYVSIIIAAIILSGCADFYQENQMLRNELRNTEIEIASIKGAPGYMLGEAFEMLDQKEYSEAVKLIDSLRIVFPEWNKDLLEEFSGRIKTKIEERQTRKDV